MSCNDAIADAGALPVRLRGSAGERKRVVASIQDRVLVIPVSWSPHYFYECESWTFDREAMQHYGVKFVAVEFRLHRAGGRVTPFRLPAELWLHRGHSSFSCTDAAHAHPEKWHCPLKGFSYDWQGGPVEPPPHEPQAKMDLV